MHTHTHIYLYFILTIQVDLLIVLFYRELRPPMSTSLVGPLSKN